MATKHGLYVKYGQIYITHKVHLYHAHIHIVEIISNMEKFPDPARPPIDAAAPSSEKTIFCYHCTTPPSKLDAKIIQTAATSTVTKAMFSFSPLNYHVL